MYTVKWRGTGLKGEIKQVALMPRIVVSDSARRCA